MRIHHIGYLVKKLDKGLTAFTKLGFNKLGEVVYDEIRNVDILFIEKDGYVVELVSPKSRDSAVGELMKKYGNSPYHICYEVDDIEKAREELAASGYVSVDEPTVAVAIDSRRVTFLLHPFMGMVELVETKEKQ